MELIVIKAATMPKDVNKFVADYLKRNGLKVIDADVQLLVESEPGRTWVKRPGQCSVTAYG